MAITTLAQVISGFIHHRPFAKGSTGNLLAGRPHSLWGFAGNTGTGAFDNTLNGVTLSSTSGLVPGQLYRRDPVSGNAYISRFYVTGVNGGVAEIWDRLWHNGNINVTIATAQTITSPTWPARDVNGSTNGDGVLLALEVSAQVGAAAPTITVSYTNESGTAGRTGTNILATANSVIPGTIYPISLQAGDEGVRSVQSITLSTSWLSGTINLVAYRPLVSVEFSSLGFGNAVDFVSGAGPRVYDGTVPFIVIESTGSANVFLNGVYAETGG